MDHERVNVNRTSSSCGVIELSRMAEDLNDVLFAIANRFYHPARGAPPAFAMFSNVDNVETVAHRISKEIVGRGFGTITKTESRINPNTGNPIAVWVWGIDHAPFKAFYVATKKERIK